MMQLQAVLNDQHEESAVTKLSMLTPVEFANLETFQSPELRCKLNREVKKMDRYSYTDVHNRVVTYTSMDRETRQSVSSYVCLKLHDSSITFGRIKFFFKHTLSDDVYAYVHWFDKPGRDPETNLFFVFLNSFSSLNPVTLISILSNPLVTAEDLDIPCKLWILSNTSHLHV